MDDTAYFSNRGNARRAAQNMITKGTAPALDYGIKPRDDGRFEIVWKTAEAKASPTTTDEVEAELAAASATADEPVVEPASVPQTDGSPLPKWLARMVARATPDTAAEPEPDPFEGEPDANGGESAGAANAPAESELAATAPPPATPEAENPWSEGTRVMVRKGKSWSEATMVRRLDADYWRVQYPAGGSGVFQEGDIRAYDDARDAKPARQPRRGRATAPRTPPAESRSRYAIDPAAIAAGKLPDKAPVVSSATNQLYQKKFDGVTLPLR